MKGFEFRVGLLLLKASRSVSQSGSATGVAESSFDQGPRRPSTTALTAKRYFRPLVRP